MTQCCVPCGYRPVTHCIFDLDGLLLDTERLYTEVTKKILDKYGKTFSNEIKLAVMGLQNREAAEKTVALYDLPITWEEYSRMQRELCENIMPTATMKPGAQRLLNHLYAHGIPMALATSSGEPAVELKTQNYCVTFDMFNHKVCGSTDPEIKEGKGKPAPDIFLIAAKRFCPVPHPSKCLVFEDAPNGVKAAFAAGMQCVMVPENHVPPEMRCGTQVLNSLEDFKPEDFGLPPYPVVKMY